MGRPSNFPFSVGPLATKMPKYNFDGLSELRKNAKNAAE